MIGQELEYSAEHCDRENLEGRLAGLLPQLVLVTSRVGEQYCEEDRQRSGADDDQDGEQATVSA